MVTPPLPRSESRSPRVQLFIDMMELVVDVGDFVADVIDVEAAGVQLVLHMIEFRIDVPHFLADVLGSAESIQLIDHMIVGAAGVLEFGIEGANGAAAVAGFVAVIIVGAGEGHSAQKAEGEEDGEEVGFHNLESWVIRRARVCGIQISCG